MKSERIEAMSDILQDLGIELTLEQIERIVEDFSVHIEMEREMSFYSTGGFPSKEKSKCKECENLKSEIKRLENREEVFIQNVKRRRNCDEVWIEKGNVMYK